jgi:hypothetical protein
MTLRTYDRAILFYEGSALGEIQDFSVEFLGAHEAVETMANGGSIRGFIRSEAKGMNVTGTLRIRKDGSEFQDIIDDWKNGTIVAVHVWTGGVQFGSKGVVDLGGLAGKDGTLEINFKGAAPEVF